MEQKRSSVGIAAGVIYTILMLNTAIRLVLDMIHEQQLLELPFILVWIPDILGVCGMLFCIISLFRGRRSWLLVIGQIIEGLLSVWSWIAYGETFALDIYFVISLLSYIAAILTAVMTVFFCVPALRDYAGWTGKVWFLPAVFAAPTWVQTLDFEYGYYFQTGRTNMLVLAINLIMVSVPCVWYLLFGLWLTEPVRHKKTA